MTAPSPKSIGDLLRSFRDGLTEPFRLARVNRRVQAQRDKIEVLSDEQLGPYLESEWSRAKDLDDKLQKLTAALSVAVTVGGLVATTILQDLNAGPAKYLTAALFLIAALYLLGGVWLGFNGLRPKPRWGYGVAFITVAEGKDKVAARKGRIDAVANFERDNLIRSNETSAATSAIRNGVLFFGVALIFGVEATSLGKSNGTASKPKAKGGDLIVRISAGAPNQAERDAAEVCADNPTKDSETPAPTADETLNHRPDRLDGRAPIARALPSGRISHRTAAVSTAGKQESSISCVASASADQQPSAIDREGHHEDGSANAAR